MIMHTEQSHGWCPCRATEAHELGCVVQTALTRGMRQISICVYYLKQNGQSAFAGFHQFSRPTVTVI